MKISFPLFHKNTFNKKTTGVWGEEIIANACCKVLEKAGHETATYGLGEDSESDIRIYTAFNLLPPGLVKKKSGKNILWIQGFTYGNDKKIVPLDVVYNGMKDHYDLIISSSRVLAEKFNLPFLVPPIDLELYSPSLNDKNTKYHDISFIGNIIKPWETNCRYLSPMAGFNYKLYGGDFGKVSHDKWRAVVSCSAINLHYGFKEGIEWDMVTGSTLFLAAVKGFCMSDKVPFLMEKFPFAFTEGGEEEKEQIKYYLENEDLRKKMSSEAYDAVRQLDFSTLADIVKDV